MNTPMIQQGAQALPAYLQARQGRGLAQTLTQNLGVSAPPRVSIKGGRFNLVDPGGNEIPVPTFDPHIGVYLDACIVDANEHLSRQYYDKPFDPQAQAYEAPACWSDNGVAPSASAQKPQSPTCNGCEKAVWGSKTSTVSGKAVPACAMHQKLALYVPGFDQMMFQLQVPPNSLKNLRQYIASFSGQQIDLNSVITRIHFDLQTQGTLLFTGVGLITEQMYQVSEQAYAEKKTDALVGRNDVPRTAPIPAIAGPAAHHTPVPPVEMAQPTQFAQGAPQAPFASGMQADMAAGTAYAPQFAAQGGGAPGFTTPQQGFQPPPPVPAAPQQGFQPPPQQGFQAAPQGWAPGPQNPPAGTFANPAPQQSAPVQQNAPAASPEAPKRRRGRPAAQPAPPQPGPAQQSAPQAPFPGPGQSGPSFGVGGASAAGADMIAMLRESGIFGANQ